MSSPAVPFAHRSLVRLASLVLDRDRWLLTLLCALLYLPGVAAIPPLDRDESRYAQASKQMLETGDFVGIYFQDHARAKKPVGIHWLQAGAVAVFGRTERNEIWPYRVPSVIGAWLAAQLTLTVGRVLFGGAAAWWAAALLAGCVNLVVAAHLATTDAALLAAIAAAQWALAVAYAGARGDGSVRPLPWSQVAVFWSALGIGALIKGPMGVLVTLLTAASLSVADRDWRWLRVLRPLPGLLILAAWVLPWSLAVTVLRDAQFIARALSEDMLAKLLTGQEGHGAPPGAHFVATLLFLWPASLFLLPALLAAWRARRQTGVRFCLAWIAPTWLLFELIATKLPHYLLTTYPALALLIGAALAGALPAARESRSRAGRVWTLIWVGMTVALAAVLAGGGVALGDGGIWWPALAAAAMLLAGALPGWLALRGRPLQAAAAAVATAALAVAILAGIYVPRLRQLWISPAIAAAVDQITGQRPPRVVSADYHEPSLVFWLGTDTLLTDGVGAAHAAAAQPGTVAIVDESDRALFLAELSTLGRRAIAVTTVQGLNYSKGRRVALTVFRIDVEPPSPERGARPAIGDPR